MFRQLRALLVMFVALFFLIIGPVAAVDNINVTGNSSSQPACALLESMLGGAGINLSEQSFNLSEQSFNLAEQSFNLSEQSFNLAEQGFSLSEQSFNLAEQSFNLSEQSFNLAEQSFNLAEQSFNLSEQSFNLAEQGFSVAEQGFNLSEQGFNLAEQEFDAQGATSYPYLGFTWLAPLYTWNPKDENGDPINSKPSMVLMNYGDPVNVAAEVGLHSAPDTWGADLLSNAGVLDTPSLHGTQKVAVIFVDVGDVSNPDSHMSEVVGVFDRLNLAAAIPNLRKEYIDISDPSINFRVSDGYDTDSEGNLIHYIGIEGALRDRVNSLIADGYSNIVINMSLAFIPCADEIETASGYTFNFDIDNFIEEYNKSVDPTTAQETEPIQPVAECVFQSDANGKWYARFGYINSNHDSVSYDAGGNNNRFSPNPQYRDQPSIFEPGTHRGVVEIRFSKPSITWEIVDQNGVPHPATAYINAADAPNDLPTYDTVTRCDTKVNDTTFNPVGSVVNSDGSLLAPAYPVEPILECVRQEGDTSYAVFGYYNWNDGFTDPQTGELLRPARTVYVPSSGKNNKFSPNPGNRGQATHFLPGEQPYVFEIPFKSSEQDITWTLSSDWVEDPQLLTQEPYNFPTTIVAEAHPSIPMPCADAPEGTNLGNYLGGFDGVPEDEVLNVLVYLLNTETVDDMTDTSGLRGLLNEYLQGSQANPSPYNIVAVASSGNYRPWFSILQGIPNIAFDGANNMTFLDLPVKPLAPARWPETIAVSASLGNDAWALFDDDNENATIIGDTISTRSIPDNNDGTLNPWEDELAPDTEDNLFRWMRWFFSHDGDIMARGAGYNVGTTAQPESIAGTSFSSPGAAYVLAQYFSFPDACTFAPALDASDNPILDDNGDPVYNPPVRLLYADGNREPLWENRELEEPYGTGPTPLWCDTQTNQAQDDEYSVTDKDGATALYVLDNDIASYPLSIVSVTQPDSGASVAISEDGQYIIFTPFENIFDDVTDVSFTYVVGDGYATSEATVTVTITPINDAPIAVDDSYTVNEDEPFSVAAPGVLSNDSDVDNAKEDLIAVPVGDLTANGAIKTEMGNWVTLKTTGSFYYTSEDGNVNFNGTDSFKYKACDPDGACSNEATVTITVNPVNDAPTADSQTIDTIAGIEVSFTLTGSDPDGDPLTFSLVGTNNRVEVYPDGSATYTAPENATGTDSFTFQVCDPSGECDTADVTVNILGLCLDAKVSATPNVLEPPNNKYQSVTIRVEAADPTNYTLWKIYQDEPLAHFEPDAVFESGASIPPDGLSILIRAERDGKGDGRVYTIILKHDIDELSTCAAVTYVYVDHDARNSGAKWDSTKP